MTKNRNEAESKADVRPPVPLLLTRRERAAAPARESRWVWSDQIGWVSSCVFHTLLLLLLMLFWRPDGNGTGSIANQVTGISVVSKTSPGDQYFVEGGSAGAGTSGSSSVAGQGQPGRAASSAADSDGPPVSVDDLVSNLIGQYNANGNAGTGDSGTGLSGTGTAGAGNGTGNGFGSATKTSFMGVEGTGASFVYVFDRSDSMNEAEGAPLRYAKGELINSIASLQSNHQFQIVFYNDAPAMLSTSAGGAGRMIFGNDTDKQRATRFVKSMTGMGGTEHVPAIKMGLSLGPDVLFFLTDAAEPPMTQTELLDIQQRAERSNTTIHAIEFRFGEQQGDGGWIRTLAEMNRGTYRYVNISSFEK